MTSSVTDKIETIKSQCQVEGFFYNAMPQEQALSISRPPNVTPLEWEKAIAKKPTSYSNVPIKWEGFQEVFNRVELQTQHVNTCRNLLSQIELKLDTLINNHTLNTKLSKCQLKQRSLDSKLLKIAINLSILKSKGYPLSLQEEQLIQAFNNLMDKMNNPMGVVRITELWAKLNKLKEQQSIPQLADTPSSKGKDGINGNESLKDLIEILGKQQEGIQMLSGMVQKDLDAIQTYNQQQQSQNQGPNQGQGQGQSQN